MFSAIKATSIKKINLIACFLILFLIQPSTHAQKRQKAELQACVMSTWVLILHLKKNK